MPWTQGNKEQGSQGRLFSFPQGVPDKAIGSIFKGGCQGVPGIGGPGLSSIQGGPMALILDGNSKHVAHNRRKIGL